MHHDLKQEREHFEDVIHNNKRLEIRFNDRNYKVGDTCTLNEFDHKKNMALDRGYSGAFIKIKIMFVTKHEQKKGWVAFCFVIL